MSEMTFEEQLISTLKQQLISNIQKQDLIRPSYERRELPKHYIDDLWESVDWNTVIEKVKPEMEKRICNAIIGNMETEIKTDIKKLMGVEGVREKLRIEIYPKIMAVLSD